MKHKATLPDIDVFKESEVMRSSLLKLPDPVIRQAHVSAIILTLLKNVLDTNQERTEVLVHVNMRLIDDDLIDGAMMELKKDG